MTVFVISQRVSAVRGADLILVLDDGRLVAQGVHDALIRDSDIYREICSAQSAGEEAVG